MKKVSVIIPAYNKAELTVKAVISVLRQTYDNIEIIVVDDGSIDNTRAKLRVYDYFYKINYMYQENKGACNARNLGIRLASGDYIALLDCDDIYYPEKIAKSVKYLEENPDCGFVYTNAYLIDANDEWVSNYSDLGQKQNDEIVSELFFNNVICNSTSVVRKECFEKVGLFDEKIFIPADWDMSLRLSEKYRIGYIAERLTGYRISENYSKHHQKQALEENLYVMKKMFDRNNITSKFLIGRCYANVYIRALVRLLRRKMRSW